MKNKCLSYYQERIPQESNCDMCKNILKPNSEMFYDKYYTRFKQKL